MATLNGSKIKDTYPLLLKVNTGISGDFATGNVEDGDATASALQISSAGIKSTGTLAVDGASTLTGATTIQGLTVGKGGGAVSNNSAMGVNALISNTTGDYNTAMGVYALYSNTTGNYNSAMGLYALRFNTTGTQNSAMGVNSLRSNTTGNYNSAMGLDSLYFNTTGYNNSAMGLEALCSNTTGYSNSAMGLDALYDNTTGYKNTAVGYNTGRGITTGNSNTIIGANVTGLSTTLSNNIIIADGDGVQRIMVNSSGSIYQSNNSSTWAVTSDNRTKENIEIANLQTCFDNIKNLKLKRFNFKNEVFTDEQVKDRGQLGLIAQEVEEYFPKSITKNDLIYNQKFEDVIIPAKFDENGIEIEVERTEKKLISEEKIENCYSLDSSQIIWALYGAVQHLITKVEALEAK